MDVGGMIYLDTSALLKLYIAESDSAYAQIFGVRNFVIFDARQRALALHRSDSTCQIQLRSYPVNCSRPAP